MCLFQLEDVLRQVESTIKSIDASGRIKTETTSDAKIPHQLLAETVEGTHYEVASYSFLSPYIGKRLADRLLT